MPSVRKFISAQHDVRIATVLQGYILLEDKGLIEARPHSGYYVRAVSANFSPTPNCAVSFRQHLYLETRGR